MNTRPIPMYSIRPSPQVYSKMAGSGLLGSIPILGPMIQSTPIGMIANMMGLGKRRRRVKKRKSTKRK